MKNKHEGIMSVELRAVPDTVNDGWSLPTEPARGRVGPTLVRSTRMNAIDDGWVLLSEPVLRLVSKKAAVPVPVPVDDGLIELNTASHAELQTLPGVGQGKASRIVSWRKRNGGFKSVDDLAKVSGFGARSVAKLAELLKV